MGSKQRRERERADTRQKILDAARHMFVRVGYDATTMRAIAERIEYTPTAIYHHFRNKEALLTELSDVDFRALQTAFLRIGHIDDPIERLDRMCTAYVDFAVEHPMQYALMFMTPRPQIESTIRRGDPGEDAYAFLRETCAEAIRDGRLRPEYDDPDQVAQMIWGGVHGVVSLCIAKEHDVWVEFRDVRETTRLLGKAVMRGLLREPD